MDVLHFFILFLLLLSTEMGVEAGGCICVNTIRILEDGRAEKFGVVYLYVH